MNINAAAQFSMDRPLTSGGKNIPSILSSYEQIIARLVSAELDPEIVSKNQAIILKGHEIRIRLLWTLGRYSETIIACDDALKTVATSRNRFGYLKMRTMSNIKTKNFLDAWFDIAEMISTDPGNKDVCELIFSLEKLSK
jgi:hypothetical protein